MQRDEISECKKHEIVKTITITIPFQQVIQQLCHKHLFCDVYI